MKNLVQASFVVAGIVRTWRAYQTVHFPALCLQNLTKLENNFDKYTYSGFMGIKQPRFYLLHLSFGTIMARNSHFFSICNMIIFTSCLSSLDEQSLQHLQLFIHGDTCHTWSNHLSNYYLKINKLYFLNLLLWETGFLDFWIVSNILS